MNNNPDVKHISKCLNKSIFSTSFRNPYGALKGNTQWRGLALLSHSLSFLKTSSTIVWFGIKPPFSQLIIALYFTLAFKKKEKEKKRERRKKVQQDTMCCLSPLTGPSSLTTVNRLRLDPWRDLILESKSALWEWIEEKNKCGLAAVCDTFWAYAVRRPVEHDVWLDGFEMTGSLSKHAVTLISWLHAHVHIWHVYAQNMIKCFFFSSNI